MKSAVTICLVAEARGGPFVFHEGLSQGCARASELGFDAVEIFPPSADAVPIEELKDLLKKHRLKVAAFGTGAGWLRQQLSLTSSDSSIRQRAVQFIRQIIDLAAEFKAPAIIGSMQGRIELATERDTALKRLADGLRELSAHAKSKRQVLLYEPLNRYETNVFHRLGETAEWLRANKLNNVKILADLFHMNIEEANLPKAIREAGPSIGHVHFADSNRRAVGMGHTRMKPVIAALEEINYRGYLSAEIFPFPDSDQAATQTIKSFNRFAVRSTSETTNRNR